MLAKRHNTFAITQNSLPATPSTSTWTTVTGSSTIHTKGVWAQLIASTTHDTYGFWLNFGGTTGTATITACLLDIGIGANPNEVVLIENLNAASKVGVGNGGNGAIFVPLFIAKGTRIVARIQGLIASETLQVAISCNQGNSGMVGEIYQGCDTYGATTASSRGTDITAGNSGAEGSDTNVGSTTTKPYKAVDISVGAVNNTAQTALAYHYELRVGSQTLGEWYIAYSTSEIGYPKIPSGPAYANIPSGVQLQVRGEASGTAQINDVLLHCYY